MKNQKNIIPTKTRLKFQSKNFRFKCYFGHLVNFSYYVLFPNTYLCSRILKHKTMKATLKIYGQDYEIEIKARDKRNLNSSKKATEKVIRWIEARMWDSSHEYEEEPEFYKEIRNNASTLHNLINKD